MAQGPAASNSVEWFHRGEVVIVARVPRERAQRISDVEQTVSESLRTLGGPHLSENSASIRSFVFNAPNRPLSLVFFFQKLEPFATPAAVKETVETLQPRLADIGDANIEAISATPHWHLRAHEAYSGGSPGSLPRPLYPDQVPAGWTSHYYQPVDPRLDLADRVANRDAVPVAILDTRVDLARARQRAEHFSESAHNAQLKETVDWLDRCRGDSASEGRLDKELDALEQEHHYPDAAAGGEQAAFLMPDHGLFVASLIHGIAPTAPLTLDPVLNERGVGDLSSLLLGLQRVLERKARPDAPQIVNLSLGFLPHPARLPAAWYGLPRRHDRQYVRFDEMYDAARDMRWATAHRADVDRHMSLLQVGLGELGTYLSWNNCLVVAATGNDSQPLVEAGWTRMEPRLPARLGTVLGVAATGANPRQAAPYSNMGDESELGDHVATFGGVLGEGPEVQNGIVGAYGDDFPDGRRNETGWALWSGTSFATAIVSGIAANYWAREPDQPAAHAASVRADLHADVSATGPYVPALRTPSIEVRGRWRRGS